MCTETNHHLAMCSEINHESPMRKFRAVAAPITR